ncbi:MAG: hypothetical protein RLZZ480_624 [Candidatus Parcubacteria bacterium]|jgi:hypothetical protein
MHTENSGQEELKALILENQRLLAENNELLKKMHRGSVRHLWFTIAYVMVFLGLPVVLYYYFLAPYMDSIKSIVPGEISPELQELIELQGAAMKSVK